MKHFVRKTIKNITPPIFLRLLRRQTRQSGFRGNYANWQEAKKHACGYDDDLILNKVKKSLLKVKKGEAVYERDSVLFDEVQYSWPLLFGLLWVASNTNNKLNLIDFGGSLGSSYFQNIKFLRHLNELHWNIVEQPHFVRCGQKYFRDQYLKFYYSIEDCLREQQPNLILFSSVIQYLEKPYEMVKRAIDNKFDYIIFDRTTLVNKEEKLAVQKVPPEIYNASYPVWFLNRDKFLNLFVHAYELITEFDALAGQIEFENLIAEDKGFIFKLKNA